MILYTLDELKAKRDRIQKEIDNYDLKTIWKECFDKMGVSDYKFEGDNPNYLKIIIPDHYVLYSWELPKGSFVIRSRYDNKLVIELRSGAIKENKEPRYR